MKTTSFETGMNRTGISTSPFDSPKLIKEAAEVIPPPGDARMLELLRAEYMKSAEPIGSIPPPTTIKGMAKTAMQALKGDKAPVFIDKLGERLAFERTGSRLYGLVIGKFDVFPSWPGGPTREDLIDIQEDELSHFGLMVSCMEQLGADPTAMTPCANLQATLSNGLKMVLADPRIDIRQSLEALLVAELADTASWSLLVELARAQGKEDMALQFEAAHRVEEQHLIRVKGWLREGVLAASEAKLPSRETEAPL